MSLALLHMDPIDGELYGVWIDHGGVPLAYYKDEEGDEAALGYELVLSADWESQLLTLPEASPYIARWGVVERLPNETPERLFARVSK